MVHPRPAKLPRPKPPSGPGRPLSTYAVIFQSNGRNRIIIKKSCQFVKMKPGDHLWTPDHMAPAPANHPMIMKIRGNAICADKGIKGPATRAHPRACPRTWKAIGNGEKVVILRQG